MCSPNGPMAAAQQRGGGYAPGTLGWAVQNSTPGMPAATSPLNRAAPQQPAVGGMSSQLNPASAGQRWGASRAVDSYARSHNPRVMP